MKTILFRLLQESTDALCIIDNTGRIQMTNPAFRRLFCVTPESIHNRDSDWLRPASCILPRLDATLPTGFSSSSFDTELADPTGRVIPASLSITRLQENDGTIFHALVIRDIQERRSFELLREREMAFNWQDRLTLQTVVDRLHLGVLVLEHPWKIHYANLFCRELFGEMILDTDAFEKHVLADDPDGLALRRQLENEQKGGPHITLHRRDIRGEMRVLEADVHEDPGSGGRRIVFFYDVTDLHRLRTRLEEPQTFQAMTGRSDNMRAVYHLITEVARVDLNVLIEGETGTGKELAARAIHNLSPRAQGPFIAVNLAGLPDALLESQLFGHRRGSFTGAVEDVAGVFEAAGGGTLFLDEIGDIPTQVQLRLLRVLETREVVRIGETKARPVNVRVVAATHRDLSEEVAAGRFRRDLLYRLRIGRIPLPPLRERRVDIPLLAETFLHYGRETLGKETIGFSRAAMGQLLAHDWPGNIRELKHAIEYALLSARGNYIEEADLPPEVYQRNKAASGGRQERVLRILAECDGNRSRAAEALGVTRATLYRWLRDWGIALKFPRRRRWE